MNASVHHPLSRRTQGTNNRSPTLKAIILNAFGSADNFHLADLPMPEVRPGEVRIKVKAMSFNPVDYQIRKGQPEGTPAQSMILGRDLSGFVDAVHADVADFRVGDPVFSYVAKRASSGTYVEYVSVPAELVARKPVSLTHEQAAAVPVAGITAILALKQARCGAEKSLFIAGGAGGVGTFAILLARQLGVSRLTTTAGNTKSRDYLIRQCRLREDEIVNYRDADFIDQALRRNGGGFDCVLDLVGGRMLSACCALLALEGNLASVVDPPSTEDFEIMFEKNASFHSVGAHAYSLVADRAVWRRYREMLDELARGFDSGTLAPPPITVLGELSVEVVKEAHALMESGAVQGKLVMSCP